MAINIKNKSILKFLILSSVLFTVTTASFAFIIWTHEIPNKPVEFALLNQSNQTVTEQDLLGQYSMVYFGFTRCIDICPVHMAKLTQTLKDLDTTGHGDLIKPVFITVDPEHDSPEVLTQFLAYFDQRFVGLTGDRPALKAAALSFKTYFQALPKQDLPKMDDHQNSHSLGEDGHANSHANSHANRQIPHATVVYLVNQQNEIIDYVSANKSSEAIAQRIRKTIL